MATALAERCEDIRQAADMHKWSRRQERVAGYEIRFWDGNWDLAHVVMAENDLDVTEVENDTGSGKLELDGDQPAAKWLWSLKERMDAGETIDAFMTVDYVGKRLGFRVEDIVMKVDDLGIVTVTAMLEHDYEQLKARTLWPTPFTPAGFQPIKVYIMGGPAHWAAATSLWVNLARAHGNPVSGWTSDPLAETTPDYTNWPIVIEPFSYAQAQASGVTTGLIVSRMKTWHEACQPVLDDADVTTHLRRYLPGDPPPWTGANLTYGTLVVSFEYHQDLADDVSGGLAEGIGELIRIFLNSIVEGIGGGSPLPVETGSAALTGQTPPPAYQVPGYLGTDPKWPYVIYKADSPGILSFEAHKKPAKYLRFTGGGHSMPGVNELISAAVQAIGDALAAIPLAPIPPLGGVADAILAPFYEDVVLAFMTVYLQNRGQYGSRFGLYEQFVTGADKAYTLSATMVLRTAIKATDTQFSAAIEIVDGAPWWVGANGHGDMDLGTRILMQAPVGWSDRVYSQRIKKLQLTASPGSAPAWKPTIGAIEPAEDAFAKSMKKIEKMVGALKMLGVF